MPHLSGGGFERHLPTACYSLQPFVRHYTQVHISSAVRTAHIVPAQADLFIQLLVGGTHQIRDLETAEENVAPLATLVGPSKRPAVAFVFEGPVELFICQLQPTALRTFRGMRMRSLLNNHTDAAVALVFDPSEVIAELGRATSDARRVEAADHFARSLFHPGGPPDAVGLAAQELRDNRGRLPLKTLDRVTGLSHRQLQRRFATQVGVAPKTYSRLCRMSGVLEARGSDPRRTWADLAAEFGFSDQAHLSREFQELTRQCPSQFSRYP